MRGYSRDSRLAHQTTVAVADTTSSPQPHDNLDMRLARLSALACAHTHGTHHSTTHKPRLRGPRHGTHRTRHSHLDWRCAVGSLGATARTRSSSPPPPVPSTTTRSSRGYSWVTMLSSVSSNHAPGSCVTTTAVTDGVAARGSLGTSGRTSETGMSATVCGGYRPTLSPTWHSTLRRGDPLNGASDGCPPLAPNLESALMSAALCPSWI